MTSTAAGAFLGERIPDPLAWGLDFAMPAMFLALLIPRLAGRTAVVVCATATAVAVLGVLYLPGKWYIIVACLAAVAAGGLSCAGLVHSGARTSSKPAACTAERYSASETAPAMQAHQASGL